MNLRGVGHQGRINAKATFLFALGLIVVMSGFMALSPDPAAAKYKQSNCRVLMKNLKKAKSRNQRLRLKFKLTTCRKNLRVYNRVKNSRFVGVRSDGEPIDITLCANGKSADEAGMEFEDVYRAGWRIVESKLRGKYFEAGFAASLGGGGERVGSLKFGKSGWEVGIYSLGKFDNYGPATKTDATRICRTL